MKTYSGAPASAPGTPPVVMAVEGAVVKVLEQGPFAWGKDPLVSVQAAALAKALLLDHLGDAAEANRLHRRFMWRTVHYWDAGKSFTITGAEIAAVLKQIGANDETVAKAAAAVDRERLPIEREGGIGVGGIAFSPIVNKG